MKHSILSAVMLFACAAAANAQIIIAEIMRNAEDVVDSDGEWFEVYNATGSAIDLQGWDIIDNGTESHTIASSVVVPAKGLAVLCNNANPLENAINGGYVCDYEYSGIILFNTTDAIILRDQSDTEIDRVEYDATWPPSNVGFAGASMVFVGSATDNNNDPNNWMTATLREPTFGANPINCCDLGSPGTTGSFSTLSVELTRFDAIVDDREVVLRWETGSETSNSGFGIEHKSDAAFANIAFVEGSGSSKEPRYYEHRVAGLPAGRHTFRLRQVDFDGTFAFSPQIEVSILPVDSYELTEAYPNPFNPNTTFQLTLRLSQRVQVDIVDMQGRNLIRLFDGELAAGERQTFLLNASSLASGPYVYKVTGEDFIDARILLLVK